MFFVLSTHEINANVRQGFLLGPTLLLFYINDPPRKIHRYLVNIYDTPSKVEIAADLSSDLTLTDQWGKTSLKYSIPAKPGM